MTPKAVVLSVPGRNSQHKEQWLKLYVWKLQLLLCVCVCERERDKEDHVTPLKNVCDSHQTLSSQHYRCLCSSTHLIVSRAETRQWRRASCSSGCVCVCVCVCVRRWNPNLVTEAIHHLCISKSLNLDSGLMHSLPPPLLFYYLSVYFCVSLWVLLQSCVSMNHMYITWWQSNAAQHYVAARKLHSCVDFIKMMLWPHGISPEVFSCLHPAESSLSHRDGYWGEHWNYSPLPAIQRAPEIDLAESLTDSSSLASRIIESSATSSARVRVTLCRYGLIPRFTALLSLVVQVITLYYVNKLNE